MALSIGELKYIELYKAMSTAMTEDNSVLDVMIGKLKQEFDEFGIDNEQKSQLLSQAYQQVMTAYNKDALSSVSGIAQYELTNRQTQGYNDNMLIKVMEQQGGVTSFAVNSDSDSAQDTIFDLKDIMFRVQDRVEKVTSEEGNGIVSRVSQLAPSNLRTSVLTSTAIVLEWDAVPDAISYRVYKDGVFQSNLALLSQGFYFTGIEPDTKYAFNVEAVQADGVSISPLSTTFMVRTPV